MTDFIQILLLAFLGSILGLVGDLVFIFSKRLARLLSLYTIPLAAGVLLAVSFLDLLPEAYEFAGKTAFAVILVVYVGLFLIENFVIHLHHHSQKDKPAKGSVIFVIFGDTIHNFLDGVAIAASFMVDPKLGLIVAISTFLHEVPHEVVDFGILLSAKWSPKKALGANFISAMATFFGAIFTYFVSSEIAGLNGFMLSIAAALFLYVATTDFLPAIVKHKHHAYAKYAVSFIIGILLIAISTIVLPGEG